jgi:hypothetical protein
VGELSLVSVAEMKSKPGRFTGVGDDPHPHSAQPDLVSDGTESGSRAASDVQMIAPIRGLLAHLRGEVWHPSSRSLRMVPQPHGHRRGVVIRLQRGSV